jgi:hypothetical protein
LDGKVSKRGVFGPNITTSALNELILDGLKGEGIDVEFETINE